MLTQQEINELERNIIEAALFMPDTIYDISDVLSVEDFQGEEAKEIYGVIIDHINSGKNYDALQILDLVSLKSRDYIYNIESTLVSKVAIKSIIKKIKEYAILRKARQKIKLIYLDKTINPQKMITEISTLEQSLSNDNDSDGIVNIYDMADRILEKNEHIGEIEGYSWGIRKLDRITAGIIPGETYVIGALKKSGKSRFVINTIYNLSMKGVPSLFMSLEMGEEKVTRWLISRFSQHKINTDDFRFKNRLNITEYENAVRRIFKNNNILIDTRPGLSFMQIRNQIWRQLQKGIKVVFIDYLQRIYVENKNDNRATALQKLIGYIADMAKEFNIAVIMLSQLGNISEKHFATLADIKESGGIAENTSCIMIMNNIDRIKNHIKPEEKTNKTHLTIVQRDGESGVVILHTLLQYCEFYEEERWEI